MKKLRLRSCMMTATLALLSTAALAQGTAETSAISTINNILKPMGVSEAQPLPELAAYLKEHTSTTMVPVRIDRSMYLLADEGKTLVSLGETTFVSGNSFISGTDMLVNMTLEKTDTSMFPSHGRPDNKTELLVFTDPTCIYCKKVDEELQQYLDAGVKLTYIPFPRGGLNEGSVGYDKWVSAYCSADPASSYHDLVMGKDLSSVVADESKNKADCAANVAKGYNLGLEVGVRGTPYMILKRPDENNINIAGYTPAAQLIQRAGLMK